MCRTYSFIVNNSEQFLGLLFRIQKFVVNLVVGYLGSDLSCEALNQRCREGRSSLIVER